MSKVAKTEKMSVTIPRDLAGEIRATVSQGEVSSFFTEALKHYLAYRRQRIALEKGFGAWKSRNHPELRTPADSALYVQSLRKADEKRLKNRGGAGAK